MTDSTLLPPNSTGLERAAAQTTVRLDDLPTPLRDAWNPAECPVVALPWLAWAFGVEDWSNEWSEEQRRTVIDQSIQVKRYRGTLGAVQSAINAIGITCRVREWFRQNPAGNPYTYQLLLQVDQIGYSLAQLNWMIQMVERSKNLRSHLDKIYPSAITRSTLFAGAVASVGCEITVMQSVPDYTAVTLTISADSISLLPGETAQITFDFSGEIGTSFVHGDITVTGGTLGPLSGSGLVRTALFTAGSTAGPASISVATGSYSDTAFPAPNPGLGHSLALAILDVIAPTLVISSELSQLDAGTSTTITFTFSEDIGTSFVHGDITVTGGTLGPLSGSGLVRTALFTAGSIAGTAEISVATGGYTDTAFPVNNIGIGNSISLNVLMNQVIDGTWKAGIPNVILSNSNRTAFIPTTGAAAVIGDNFCSTGIRQFEIDIISGVYPTVGVARANQATNSSWPRGGFWFSMNNGTTRSPFTGWGDLGATFPSQGFTVGIVVDFNSGSISFYANGVFKGTPFFTLAGETVAPMISDSANTSGEYTLRTHDFIYPINGATSWT